jgi:hypothetical protein
VGLVKIDVQEEYITSIFRVVTAVEISNPKKVGVDSVFEKLVAMFWIF